mmetsp:Transcript_29816/g.21567  ORF Transcript_29816/g.21567 Transcript_29816/m.21567 type:complete len:120 (+) Transcript_29816:18-377(+)
MQAALEYAPECLALKNEYAHLVDSLSYLDSSIDSDPVLKSKCQQLISLEMSSMKASCPEPKDYLIDLPLPVLKSPLLLCELDRISTNNQPLQVLTSQSMQGYLSVDQPKDQSDLESWQK